LGLTLMQALQQILGDGQAAHLGRRHDARPVLAGMRPRNFMTRAWPGHFRPMSPLKASADGHKVDEVGDGADHHAANHYICSATMSTPAQ
jgi:hypothetical protein